VLLFTDHLASMMFRTVANLFPVELQYAVSPSYFTVICVFLSSITMCDCNQYVSVDVFLLLCVIKLVVRRIACIVINTIRCADSRDFLSSPPAAYRLSPR